jgi:hypothetical protein
VSTPQQLSIETHSYAGSTRTMQGFATIKIGGDNELPWFIV